MSKLLQREDFLPLTRPARGEDRRSQILSWMKWLRDRQVSQPPAPDAGPADVVGGFELSAAPEGTPPNPDWRSAYAVAFLASALREEGVVPAKDRLDWLLTCGLGARFLAQLMFDEPGCFFVRSLEDTRGGVRLALWDNRLAIPPTAVTLLAALELEETLRMFEASGRGR